MPEVGYYQPQAYFLPALLLLAAAVAGFIVYTLLGHYLYERRQRRRERERRRVAEAFERLEKTRKPEEAHQLIRKTMKGAGNRGKAAFVTLIDGMPEPRRSEYLDHAARYEGREYLTAQALRSPFRWRRIEAIEVLGELPHPEVLDTLARCLKDDDEDVAYAAMRALARRKELYAAELLLGLFGDRKANPKRVVAMLEEFPRRIEELVWPRLEDRAPEVRTWAATVLEVSEDPTSIERLVKAAKDPDADVRSAAIRSLANIGDARGKAVLPAAFEDEAWFVRASAARLAGALEATELYEPLVRLLRDGNWWVRQNAKAALIELCPEIEERLERYLVVEDRFVRNMIAEILDASGAVERRAAELEQDPDSAEARRFFERLIVAEGRGSVEGLARRTSPRLRALLLELLENEAARAS